MKLRKAYLVFITEIVLLLILVNIYHLIPIHPRSKDWGLLDDVGN